MLTGFVWDPLGAFFGKICDGSLWCLDAGVAAANRLPGSYFWLSGPDNWWIVGFLALLALVVVKPGWSWSRYGRLTMAWMVLGLAAAAANHQQPGHCQFTFLSVGHGTSVLIRTPDDKAILYDAGSLGSPVAGARSIAGALWAEGIMRLDAIVISHADIDHYNALPELLGQFRVRAVYVSPLMFREDIEPLRLLRRAIDASGAELREISAGDQFQIGAALTIHVLHPPRAGVRGNDNAQSIVLAVESLGRRVLLPGDLEGAGTDALLRQPSWDTDIALAPHHGSQRSDPPGFSGWSRPEYVVISGGHSSDSGGRVASAYKSAGARVFHTAHDGAVRFLLNADEISVSRWHNGSWQTPP